MSWVGRADVARMLRRARSDAEDLAAMLGFERKTDPPDDGQAETRQQSGGPSPIAGAPAVDSALTMPMWHVVREAHDIEPATATERAAPRPKLRPYDVNWRPPTPDLTAWSALWPVLFDLIAEQHPSEAVDAPRLIALLSAGRPLSQVPRRVHRRWPQALRLWVDRDERLIPIWDDQDAVEQRLREVCPHLDRQVGRSTFSAAAGETALLLGDPARLSRATCERARGARVLALSPTPSGRGGWRCAVWAGQSTTDRTELLLTLAATAIWVRPGMLRALRLLLPDAGVDTELAVWQHPHVVAAQYDGLIVESEHARALRSRFAALPEALQAGVRRVIERWHARLPEEVGLIEAAIWRGRPDAPFDVARARALIHAVAHEIEAGTQGLEHFARYASDQLASALDHDPGLSRSVSLLWAVGHPEDDAVVPPGIDPTVVRAAGADGALRRWVLCQRGGEWRARSAITENDGIPLAALDTRLPTWWVTIDDERHKRPIGRPIEVAAGRRVIVETERSAVELALQMPPPWADELGRDARGLWAAVMIAGERYVLRHDGGRWTQPRSGLGADEYGVFEDVDIAGVRVRFRLIRAGEFVMGSPASEAGRFGDEGPQHHVHLTEDFWLADAPTTQAVWAGVMGTNPSQFQHPDRPAEQVSWDDALAFITAANAAQPGLGLRLPTEAQWEYACRAGSRGATWVGDLSILGMNNAPLLDPIAWYGGNSGVELDIQGVDAGWAERQYPTPTAATRIVRTRLPNPWGLYDMLGNVWEWCQDWSGSYPTQAQVDPLGPERGSKRVIRGGSWDSGAGRVRAACRFAFPPGFRSVHLGFRLSRGPAPSARSAEPPRSGEGRRSEVPPGTGGSAGQARSAGGGARPRTVRPEEATQAKRSIFSRLFGRKKGEE